MKRKLLTIAALVLMTTTALQAQTTIFAQGSSWSYNDGNVALVPQWKDANFNISTWPSGNGPLGYGDPVTTTINSGLLTAYFAKDFTVNLADLSTTMEFGIRRDDGIIVYLNGEEVIRDNMPTGTVTHGTFSSTTIDGAAETAINVFSIPKNKFVQGVNRISIELHNRSAGSSDLTIDAYLKNSTVITPPTACTGTHISCFTSIVPTTQTSKLIIPAEHR